MVSIHLILLFIRFGKVPVIVTQMFQYISCYSLSGSIGELSVVNRLFQYISCYSLSGFCNQIANRIHRFNTSHVTLYLLLLVSLAPYQIRFNTSHVTLYQASQNALTAADSGFNTSHVTLYLNGKM